MTNDRAPTYDNTPRTPAQLARLVHASDSAVSRALTAAQGDDRPLPPHHVDPLTGRRTFETAAFLTWWDARPRRGSKPGKARGPYKPRNTGAQ